MKVLAIYGSPRKDGNTDILLDEFLKGLSQTHPEAEIKRIYVRKLKIKPCTECNSCSKTGECIIEDDMTGIYDEILNTDALVLSAPMFFYNLPAQTKALVDRCQAIWARKYILKGLPKPEKPRPGFFISVGGTKDEHIFDGISTTVKFFFKSINIDYTGKLFYSKIDNKGDIKNHPTALKEAFEAGKTFMS